MLHLSINLLKTKCSNILVRFSSTNTASEKWDLCTAICLERKPAVIPSMTDIETKMYDQLIQVELERSHKSKHEVQHEYDLKQIELLKKGDVDIDTSIKQTAQDFLDASLEEYNKFKLSTTTTDVDKSNNLKSLNRKLDKNLVLLTEQKIGDKNFFLLPQGVRQDGETLRQTAERVLKQAVGNDLKAQIYGNSPVGFYKYKYPAALRSEKNVVGAKVFFYFARYNQGEISEKNSFKWLDRVELQKELPKEYCSSVKQFLIDE